MNELNKLSAVSFVLGVSFVYFVLFKIHILLGFAVLGTHLIGMAYSADSRKDKK